MKKCKCNFCTKYYPEFNQMLGETDIEKVREKAKEYFEHWQMLEEEIYRYKFPPD